MIRRKDSMSYTELMRGKYDVSDTKYVERLIENMTDAEIENIRTRPFEELWTRMWENADRHDREMPNARDKMHQIAPLLKSATSVYFEPEWGFPKGRRFRCETDMQCAEREFFEETNIPRSAYVVVKDVQFNETFLGTNGTPYQHKYFLAVLAKPADFNVHQKFTHVQKREISAIGWKTVPECQEITRPHYTGRPTLLADLTKFVGSVEVMIPNFVAE